METAGAMLDFSLFCDIQNTYFTDKKVSFSMIVENQYDDNAVVTLLKKCDKTTIVNLMEYFDEGAPIQSLLKNQLDELNIEEKQIDNLSES